MNLPIPQAAARSPQPPTSRHARGRQQRHREEQQAGRRKRGGRGVPGDCAARHGWEAPHWSFQATLDPGSRRALAAGHVLLEEPKLPHAFPCNLSLEPSSNESRSGADAARAATGEGSLQRRRCRRAVGASHLAPMPRRKGTCASAAALLRLRQKLRVQRVAVARALWAIQAIRVDLRGRGGEEEEGNCSRGWRVVVALLDGGVG
eukprot:364680-Chlamydomonas_euryale.AAC.2